MNLPKQTEKYETIVVTRHINLVPYLLENDLITPDVRHYTHVTLEEIEGKHVIGMLPLRLAANCALYTEIPLRIPYKKTGDELTLDEIKWYAQKPKTYIIKEIQ